MNRGIQGLLICGIAEESELIVESYLLFYKYKILF